MDREAKLARLLEHPSIWRGRSAAHQRGLPSGFAALDAYLPGYGWPRTGLIEILVSRFGSGGLYLLPPAPAPPAARRAASRGRGGARPLMPFAPALASQGVALDRVAVVGGARPLWALEQALGSGACDVALAWARQPKAREIRRLQLAAERGQTLGVLFRPRRAAREATAAVLRLSLEPITAGVRITLLKGRGAMRGAVDLLRPGGWPV